MDRITRSLIEELLRNQELESEGDPKDFEKLVNYASISNEYSKTFELDFVTVGDGNDTGIDGIAIIVNGQLVEDIEEVDDLLDKNGSLEITFVFTQAKTSSNFNSGEINTFIFGIKDFFAESPRLVRNQDIQRFAEIADYIYSKAPDFKSNPNIIAYYITTGTWINDQNLVAVLKTGEDELLEKNLFNEVKLIALGAKELIALYRKTKETSLATINFSKRFTIPSINGISEAYIGLLPFEEFKKIIQDDNGKLKNVFEDNVRDFQGDTNDVNALINDTVSGDKSEVFSILNNGVTIVANTISPTGDVFTIKDYQIVNGCQTSNVLYNNRLNPNIKNVYVPIKIIATDNEEIKTQITLATNNQTPIKKEQLAALTVFQRNLEQFYNTYEGENKLFYERRAKQYNSSTNVIKTRIITVPIQIKSFSAMFLLNPHLVTSYFGALVKKLNTDTSKIFKEDHSYITYYISGLAYYKLETFFRRRLIDSKYKSIRFHILMLFRLLTNNNSLPFLNSQKNMEKFCEPIFVILNNDNISLEYFTKCLEIIENSEFDYTDKQQIKQGTKTQVLIDYII